MVVSTGSALLAPSVKVPPQRRQNSEAFG